MSAADAALFPGFDVARASRRPARRSIASIGGSGPPLLLLHGYPQTHAMWHKIAPRLAERLHRRLQRSARLRRLVEARGRRDARQLFEARDGAGSGRGDARARASRASGSPATIAAGASRIACASIIRDAVERVAVLDISPTRIMYGKTDQAFATAYYHWFFLIQPFDLPERLIGADPDLLPAQEDRRLGLGGRASSIRARSPSTSAASAIRRRSTRPARTIARRRRSISSTTTRMSRQAARSTCPLLVLWGDEGRRPPAVRSARRLARGRDATCAARALPSGHYLAEEAPEETLAELLALLRRLSALASGASGRTAKSHRLDIIRRLGQVAQLVEQRTENPCVGGSIPPLATNFRGTRSGPQNRPRIEFRPWPPIT